MCACNALHEAIISSGDAVWPDRETTYFSRSVPLGSAVEDEGNVDGKGLYV